MRAALVLSLLLGPAAGQDPTYGPLTQLFKVLGEMTTDAKALMHEEQVAWSGFKEYCEGTQDRYQGTINRISTRKGTTESNLGVLNSEKASLKALIESSEVKHRKFEGNSNVMTRLLEIEKRRYQQNKESLTNLGIDLAQAITVLKSENVNVMSGTKAPGAQDDDDSITPESYVYQGSLTPVIEAFERAQEENDEEKDILESSYIDRKSVIENKRDKIGRLMTFQLEAKETTKARLKTVEDDIVKATSSAAEDGRTINSEQELLSELETSCAAKAGHFAHQQKFRRDEIEALELVVRVLQSPDVMKPHDKHYQDMVQQIINKPSTSFVQLRGEGDDDARDIRKQASQYLMDASVKYHSGPLSTLATKIIGDPFGKIRSMITEMIFALEERQRQEITKKGWCDTEMTTNSFTRNKKVIVIEDLHYAIEKLTRNIAENNEKVRDETNDINKLLEDQEKSKDLREIRAQQVLHEVRDLEIALLAIGKAKAILEATYTTNQLASASETQLVMPAFEITGAKGTATDDVMSTIYGGSAAGLEAVRQVNTVEVMFRTHVAQTKQSEKSEIDDFDRLKAKTAKTIRQKKMEIEKFERDLKAWGGKLAAKNGDLEVETKSLIEQNNYHDELFKKCIQQGLPIDQAVELSVNELVSLREALRILNGQGVGGGLRPA